MMDMIDREQLKSLIGSAAAPAVSIYTPTHRAGSETRQDPIRLKNLLERANRQLGQQGVRSPEARTMLEPAEALLTDSCFWEHQAETLAVFLSSGSMRHYRLGTVFEELVVVADAFHVKPLFRILNRNGVFYLLAISLERVRLFRGSQYGLSELALQGIPTSMEEALRYDDPEKQLQYHSGTQIEHGGRRHAMFHGHGVGTDDTGSNAQRFIRMVGKGVRRMLNTASDPLILACVEQNASIYAEENAYPHLVEARVEGNPDELSAADLWSKAWPIAEPLLRADEDAAVNRYRQQAPGQLASDDVAEIASRTRQGAVEVLFVKLDRQQWGKVGAQVLEIEAHKDRQPGDRDLLDFLATETFLRGGTVFPLRRERMPADVLAAALMRF